MENIYELADSYESLLQNIRQLINSSKYRITSYIEELNMSDSTFYAKLRDGRFTPQEVKKMAPMLSQQSARAKANSGGQNKK
jgi:ACT domain-containing protein